MEEPAHPSPTPLPSTAPEATEPLVLVLTPVKNAWGHLDRFWKNLNALDYPKSRISVAFLESDSDDHGAPEGVSTMGKLESLAKSQGAAFRRVQVFSKSFGVALKRSERHGEEAQLRRRAVMARSRNYLLSRALDDEAYVLWIDSDLHSYPAGVLRGLLASGKDIVTPNAVMSPGSRSYDLNAWQAPRVKLSWGGLAVPPAADITAASLRRMTTSSLVASCASSARVHSSKGMPKDGAAWASEAALATAADSLDRLLDPAPAQAPAAGNSTIRPRTLASEETQPVGTTGRPVVATDGNTSQQRSSMLPRENLSKLDAAARAEEEEPVDARATPTGERARPSKLDAAARAEEDPADARATPTEERARPSKLDEAALVRSASAEDDDDGSASADDGQAETHRETGQNTGGGSGPSEPSDALDSARSAPAGSGASGRRLLSLAAPSAAAAKQQPPLHPLAAGSRRTARLAALPAAEVASATGLPAEVAACLVTSAQRIVGRGGAAAKGASEPAAVESECRPLWPLREADAGSSAGAVRAGAAADGDADAGTGRSRWTTGWGEWADGPELLVEGYRPTGNLPLSKLRGDGNVTRVVELDGVGGAMLLIRADLHREGLVFPPAPYRRRIETEGLAMMARDMGHRAWGMPNLEVVHH